jgi:hypothetical protein
LLDTIKKKLVAQKNDKDDSVDFEKEAAKFDGNASLKSALSDKKMNYKEIFNSQQRYLEPKRSLMPQLQRSRVYKSQKN